MTFECIDCKLPKTLDEMSKQGNGRPANQCKDCKNLYSREYRLKNRDRLIAQDRARHAANPELKRKLARNWAKANPEKHNENTLRWYHENKDKARASGRNWSRNNSLKLRQKFYKRRAILEVGNFNPAEWLLLVSFYGSKCLCCGVSSSVKPLTIDHVVPLSCGGTNDIENTQPLCRSCNSSKGTKTIDFRPVSYNGKTSSFEFLPTIETVARAA